MGRQRQTKIRKLWRPYFANTDGLIFVVDSYDRDRIVEAEKELHMLEEGELKGSLRLAFANKQDISITMSTN